ncbi:hypothetical protein FACS189440_22390 [Bacteroidia bacterium]|nr:hypothetical protein FACS189440_22390 [Bacteroidia bacterium]
MKKIIIFIVAFIVLIIIFFGTILIKNQSIQLKKYHNNNAELTHNISLLKDNIIESWRIEHSKLNSDNIFDENGDKFNFEQSNSRLPTLIFRFSKVDCSECVVKQIDLIKKLLQNDKIRYMMICDYSNKRNLGLFKRVNNITNTVYDCNELIEGEAKTPFFCIYNNGHISNVFFPDDDFSELTEKYFKEISEKYF